MCLRSRFPALLALLISIQVCLSGNTFSQELRNTIRDYKSERVFNYQPNDPWNRGKVFNLQTGNSGRYFNCDGEQDKRNSPYICWKPHTENDIPPRVGFMNQLKLDLDQVRQRVKDGAGDCYTENCNCLECRNTQSVTRQPAGCSDCAMAGNSNPRVEVAATAFRQNHRSRRNSDAQPTSQVTHQTDVAPKFGLISGKIMGTPRPVQRVSQQASRPSEIRQAESDYYRKR